jgi:hypothetical protein
MKLAYKSKSRTDVVRAVEADTELVGYPMPMKREPAPGSRITQVPPWMDSSERQLVHLTGYPMEHSWLWDREIWVAKMRERITQRWNEIKEAWVA